MFCTINHVCLVHDITQTWKLVGVCQIFAYNFQQGLINTPQFEIELIECIGQGQGYNELIGEGHTEVLQPDEDVVTEEDGVKHPHFFVDCGSQLSPCHVHSWQVNGEQTQPDESTMYELKAGLAVIVDEMALEQGHGGDAENEEEDEGHWCHWYTVAAAVTGEPRVTEQVTKGATQLFTCHLSTHTRTSGHLSTQVILLRAISCTLHNESLSKKGM